MSHIAHSLLIGMSSSEVEPRRCPICVEEVGQNLLYLDCQHSICRSCIKGQLNARWPDKQISFNFLKCPMCREPLRHPELADAILVHTRFQTHVQELCLKKCLQDVLIADLGKLVEINRSEAIEVCCREVACFLCEECSEPFAAGRADCGALGRIDDVAIRCNGCQWKKPSAFKCSVHSGLENAVVKCDFCCDVAHFNCGHAMYCQACHTSPLASSQPLFDPRNGGTRKVGQGQVCPGPKNCPLGVPHPPNGTANMAFIIGCIDCNKLG